MCPAGRVIQYPAVNLLMEYTIIGCPTRIGKNVPIEDFEAAIEVGYHVSALVPETMGQLQADLAEKEALGQAKVVLWEDIKKNMPKALTIL